LAAVERQLTTVARQQRNLIENLANVTGTAAALIAEKINALDAQRTQLEGERQGILQRRAAWEAAQARVGELEEWRATVAANRETLGYKGKRVALDVLNAQAKVYPSSHSPRYEIDASLPLAPATLEAPDDHAPDKYCEKKANTCFQPSTACSGR
jgi:hypothetical protein